MRLAFLMNILMSKIKLHVEAFPVTVAVRLASHIPSKTSYNLTSDVYAHVIKSTRLPSSFTFPRVGGEPGDEANPCTLCITSYNYTCWLSLVPRLHSPAFFALFLHGARKAGEWSLGTRLCWLAFIKFCIHALNFVSMHNHYLPTQT